VSRRQLYAQLDKSALRALPAQRYELAAWRHCRVNIDYHVELDRHYYSVPYELLGEDVKARFTASKVAIYKRGRRITTPHRRYDRRPSIKTEQMPRAHRLHAEWTPSRPIDWAGKTGADTGRLVAASRHSRPDPEQGGRSCGKFFQGLRSIAALPWRFLQLLEPAVPAHRFHRPGNEAIVQGRN
jgi:transposase